MKTLNEKLKELQKPGDYFNDSEGFAGQLIKEGEVLLLIRYNNSLYRINYVEDTIDEVEDTIDEIELIS